ncbi:hypothetical protein [Syntrophus aciditrophicus]|uniref:Hypothetical exported protein n=1 Tax=Syntrophus aciditrophicus (strain SB) TaxID=56780 RepID=Q2LYA5_SYNAS|nr:hypothetical protein [Syntrophus aciditrophicus]ABC75971.1 hypothetical exported protein [Syntrophus aciditrophicus SB]OPY14433.1 MAG: hypothetical protein A4E74_02367 [Syntrophus sp. PtaB.Bin075]
MKTNRLVSFFLVLFLLPAWAWAAAVNQCISCHTDDQKMKSLVKPPAIGGEGEG